MEREADHVRMMDAGRLQLPYTPLVTSDGFASVVSDKFAALAHGNQYGLTFVPTPTGFAMATQTQYADGCKDFIARKLTAIDHGQNASHVDIPELALQKEVALPAIAYQLSLSPDELHLAVAYKDSLALFEVATIHQAASPLPYHVFENVVVDEIAWSPQTTDDVELRFAVLTHAKSVLSCSTDGSHQVVTTKVRAVSVAWGPAGESIAVGTTTGSVEIYNIATLMHERSIDRPDCCEEGYEAHHINWAEEDVFLIGYRQYDADREETMALACLFEGGDCVELDELVAFCDFEGRKHQYYSVFLADWRMFFIGCSLSADIELLVADPDTGEWEVWKASEKYQARLPMNSNDDEMYPLGLSLNLNAQDDIEVDDSKYPPPAIVSCATTDGLLINFSFVDMTVREVLPFVQPAEAFSLTPSRPTRSTHKSVPQTETVSPVVVEKPRYRVITSDVDNVPASEDSDDSDLEEEMEEERQKAIVAFDEIDAASSGAIDKSRFADLLVMLGTTYGEESHGKYAKRLADQSGVIDKEEFVKWYVEWVFGEQDSEDEEEEGENMSTAPSSATANALAKFAMAEGSWRCDTCMVRNDEVDAPKCISCESPNPNFKGTASSDLGSQSSATASKFNFGISASPSVTSSTSSSFRFGVDSSSEAKPASSTGFSFGIPPSNASSAAPVNFSGGFKFGVTSDQAKTTDASSVGGATSVEHSASGFQFKPAASAGSKSDKSPEVSSSTKPSTSSADNEGYGKNDENKFIESDGEDSDEEEERKEEEEKARIAFAKISSDGDSIPRDKFPALFKALGSTYSEEEHSETVDSLEREGRIHVDDFIPWYLDWLFGEEEDSDDDDENEESVRAEHTMKSPEEIAAVLAKLQPKEGSWKCSVCLCVNPNGDAAKCTACDSPNPAAPKLKLPVPPVPSSAPSVSGDFKFGGPSGGITDEKLSKFTFGFTPPTTTTSGATAGDVKADNKTPGFAFGFTPTAGANSPASVSSAFGGTSNKSFSFGLQPSGVGASQAGGGGFSFGTKNSVTSTQTTAASSSYPPDTSKRAPPPPAPGAYPPDTSKRAAPPPAPGAYPPDTSKKAPPPPAPGAYPPDTSKKAPPPPAPGAYPPDTSKKAPPPPAPGAYPPDTSKKAPPPPAPGAYPPDTSKKAPPPPAPGAYPPDTSKKAPPPPAPGAYPPDTSKKVPPPPAPGAYPPDTSKKPTPPPFALPSSSATSQAPPASSFSFGGMSSSLFGSTKSSGVAVSQTKSDAPKPPSVFSFASNAPDASSKAAPSPFGVVPKATSGFSFSGTPASATSASTGFGATANAPAFSFSASTSKSAVTAEAPKGFAAFSTPAATPSPFLLNSGAQQTKPATSAGVPKAPATVSVDQMKRVPAASRPTFAPQRPNLAVDEQAERPSKKAGAVSLPNEKPFQGNENPTRATASSLLEAQLWKLIIDFDRAFRRVNHSTQNVCSSDKTFQNQFAQQVSDLQKKVSSLCDEVNLLDDVRDQIEKDVLFVIGSDGDVHEQLEYGREILASFKNEKLKRLLEEQPLDQRSEDTRKSVQEKLAAVEQACDDLDKHIVSTKNYTSAGAFGGNLTTSNATMSTAHLFRALKQTYDSSKIQYNRVSQLAQQLEVLSVADRSAHQGVRGLAAVARSVAKSKDDMVQIITQADSRSRNVRRSFLTLCNNVVTPRDVFSTPRKKQVPSSTPSSPRDKAFSRLMPRTQVTVASPMSSAKSSSAAISFKDTPVKSGSKLFALAEDKAAPKEAKTFIATPQKKEVKPQARLAPQRPSIPTVGSESGANDQGREAFKSNEPPAKRTMGFSRDANKPSGEVSARKTLSFDVPEVNKASFGGESSFSTPKAKPSVSFNLPGESKSAFGGAKSGGPDYMERLVKFYETHNPARVAQAEKTIADFSGKEEQMFKKLFTKYIPGSTDEDVQKFLQGGPAPSKPLTTGTASSFSASSSTGNVPNQSSFSFGKSPAGPTPAASPFGKVSTPTVSATATPFGKSSFSLGGSSVGAVSSPKPITAAGGFSAFGKPSASPATFGASTTSNYKQRLIDFYTKHNPSKLGDVDSTLVKYKGNEEKLFQNLAIKYKVNEATGAPTTGFGSTSAFAPKSPAASPFGNPGTFSSISLGGGAQQSSAAFGSTSGMGFGTSKPAAAPSQSPFVTAPQDSNAFRSVSYGAEQKPAFGAPAAVGGGNSFGSFGSTPAPAFGSTNTVGAFGAAAGGVNYREKLIQFYQQHNPEKLSTVDSTLEKYRGNEPKLFQMLEQKYMKTGAAPAGGFGSVGGSPAPAFGGGSAFGAPSALGAASGPPAFGAASALGGASAPAFGSASGLGGPAQTFGSRFGSTSAPSASPTGGGFSAFSAQPASFGSFSGGQQGAAPGFGGGNAGGVGTGTGGFGSAGGFGGGTNSGGFGSTGGFGMR